MNRAYVRACVEAWLLRAEAAASGECALIPKTEVAAARQVLSEFESVPTIPDGLVCDTCED